MPQELTRLFRWFRRSGLLPVLLFSATGLLTMGYHPGAEDDGVYLAAVSAKLNPALFPHDAGFFQLQMRASMFDTWMAAFVRASEISIAWSELLWQLLAIVLILAASWSILGRLFDRPSARWAGIAALSAMLTLPVAGTALYIADQYLHPRNLATAIILLAIARILAGRSIHAIPLLICACLLHPMMGAFGVSFCVILALTSDERLRQRLQSWNPLRVSPAARMGTPVAALAPLGWIFGPPAPRWVEAMSTRHCFWLYQWAWYEWLGVIGPLVLFWLAARWATKHGHLPLARFANAVLIYGVFQQIVAMILCGPSAFVVLSTLEPMRYLQLIYIFLVLIGGALLGQYLLRGRIVFWAVFLLIANGCMFAVQRQLFASTEHLELPGRPTRNAWLQAFAWVRDNTPTGAYFALGSHYLTEPGEDMHSFRALAQRSVLADDLKDRSVLSKAPTLVPVWQRQVEAQAGWDHFRLADFKRLKAEFGVDWIILNPNREHTSSGLQCPWRSGEISVCRIP